jgi:Plasmid pRiA4b ORF-3-like protein
MLEPPESSIYQFRAILLGISPIIWRRLLIRGDSTIADLHNTLQTAFGWSDNHLHRLLIYGKQYDVESGTKRGLGRLPLFRFTRTYLHPRIPPVKCCLKVFIQNLCPNL